jgi:hypothetical protein
MSFDPQNDLEWSLMKAAEDPAHRPQFYKDLVKSDILIIQHGERPPEKKERVTLKEAETIQIANIEFQGKPHIPIFSSVPRLQAVITDEVAYLGMNALDFLKITLGSALILNPGSDYGKELTPQEAASIIDGSIWQPTETYVAEKETRVLIGQPANYPNELVEALTRFFKTRKKVKRAWVAHFSNAERDEKAHTLIAIEASGEVEEVVSEAGMVARNVQVPDPPVDFLTITGRGGVEDYFLKDTKPFYERRFLGLF